jgi:tetratricopeptide (TPR) repeat protein
MSDADAARDGELERLAATVADFRRRNAETPDGLFPAQADALLQMGTLLWSKGQRDEALAAIAESVEIFRALSVIEPQTFCINLASALNTLSGRLTEVGNDNDAATAGEAAVELARASMELQPGQTRFVLVSVLISQAGRRLRGGDIAGAVESLTGAVKVFREGGQEGAPYLGAMIEALHRSAIAFTELGLWPEAIDTRRLIVDLFPEGTPPAVVHLLALTLHQAALALSRNGRFGDAHACADEACELGRILFKADPEQYRLFMAQTLGSLAGRRHEVGRTQDSLDPALEAVDLFHTAVNADPKAAVPALVLTLESLAEILAALGLADQAAVVQAQHTQLKGAMENAAED